MKFRESSDRLIKFIGNATCSFTTVQTSIELLRDAGFKALELGADWELERGRSYYVNVYDSSLMAFSVGRNYDGGMIRIATAHTDSPSFCVKPNPEVKAGMGNIGKLNVEGYGGAILNTWLDRPLSIAMRVSVKSENVFEPEIKIIDFRRPVVTIPNLAIHMNRDVNKGVELNKQVDMLPICCQPGTDANDFFISYLADELKVNKDDILDYEGYVYNTEKGQYVGINDEFILCPRLDNATSVVACLGGIIDSSRVWAGICSNSMKTIPCSDTAEFPARYTTGRSKPSSWRAECTEAPISSLCYPSCAPWKKPAPCAVTLKACTTSKAGRMDSKSSRCLKFRQMPFWPVISWKSSTASPSAPTT